MTAPLAGKTALVTGSSSGLGAAIAKRLAAEGARLCVHGRNATRTERVAGEIEANGGTAHVAIGSLSDDTGASRVVEQVSGALGHVDILVNNAGGESAGHAQTAWFDIEANAWVTTYDSNVGSMIRMIRAFTPGMHTHGWGRLIQLASNVTDKPTAMVPDYQAAKAAVRSITSSLVAELSGSGITVNTVSPGLILSGGVENWLHSLAVKHGWGDDWATIEANAVQQIAPNHVGRIGRPEDVAAAVAFLARPEADFVNGADLRIDGGT